jgi:hypothetical protein
MPFKKTKPLTHLPTVKNISRFTANIHFFKDGLAKYMFRIGAMTPVMLTVAK